LPTISAFISDIYSTRLYAACEGFPLWNPSACNLGDIGYVRQGTFHALFNAEQGPVRGRPSFSSEVQMARRTSSPSEFPAPSHSAFSDVSILTDTTSTTDSTMTVRNNNSSPPESPETTSPRRRSITRLFSGHSSPLGVASSIALDPQPPSPMPLQVEREAPRIFDMGPRMSSNYKTLGMKVGGDLSATAGVPLSATISFESSGGTGALLIARDPIHRHLLRHRGVLKGASVRCGLPSILQADTFFYLSCLQLTF
jgi:hypothetical protein